MRRDCAAFAMALALATGCRTMTSASGGGVPEAAPPAPFFENAYFAVLTPTGKNLLFEGQPTAHFFYYNGLTSTTYQKAGTPWAKPRFTISTSELFVVRMTDTTSSPVLTPSYRIRIANLQAVWLQRKTPSSRHFNLEDFDVGLTHYSNGQHGCRWLGFVDSSDTCVIRNPTLAAQRLANTEDGDFSTTYLAAAVHARRAQLRRPGSPLQCQVSAGAELQIHPIGFNPGGIDVDQARVWGQHQFALSSEGEWRMFKAKLPGIWRVAGEFVNRFGGHAQTSMAAGSLEASYTFDRAENGTLRAAALGLRLLQHPVPEPPALFRDRFHVGPQPVRSLESDIADVLPKYDGKCHLFSKD